MHKALYEDTKKRVSDYYRLGRLNNHLVLVSGMEMLREACAAVWRNSAQLKSSVYLVRKLTRLCWVTPEVYDTDVEIKKL